MYTANTFSLLDVVQLCGKPKHHRLTWPQEVVGKSFNNLLDSKKKNGRSFEGSWFSLYILQRRQVFWMVLTFPSKPAKRHRLTSNCQALYALELGGFKKKNSSVHILYNGTSQASGALPVKGASCCSLNRTAYIPSRRESLAHCVDALFEASSLWVNASVHLFLQSLYTSGDAVSDWGRTVVPKCS